MKKLKLLLLPLIALFSSCKGQPVIPEDATGRTLLWEVSGNGLSQPSYFFGTMHILCAKDANISPQVSQVLDRVEAIYFEVDLDDMAQLFSSLKTMAMKDGTKLSDLLTEEEYQKVEAYFKDKLPLPFSLLEAYKPLLLSSMIAEQQMPCESTNGMEMMIMGEAGKRKLEIKGLETMEYQAGLFDSIPYDVQAKELVKAIDSASVQSDGIAKLLQVYREQDLDGIEKLTIEEEGGIQENIDLLLYKRNRNWVDQFAPIAGKGSVLFAVGAGHLPGKQGVLELLRQRGYTVKPLKNETNGIKKMSL
jgi:uncharacterized protein